ncbi:hypothetical protein [Chitinophaga defluvii]|uniref:YD repeat-containing protein n=1 Tax=Chitinophaga defluvii TaxID=3163343 RepID=A0ABV2TC15_9BACT
MKKVLASFIIGLTTFIPLAYSQIKPNVADAPSSAGLVAAQRESQTKVDLFTGLPDINFPLFNYKGSGLTLDLSLSYFSGGIKVEEEASEVGIGWGLNTGGIVTRNLRGLPDDYPGIGFKYAPLFAGSIHDTLARRAYNDSLDVEADLFTYNINGRSGNFIIAKNGEIITTQHTKLRIEPVYNPTLSAHTTLAGFRIIGEDGTTYLFNDITSAKVRAIIIGTETMLNDKPYGVAWHLSKIIAPFKTDSITFQYRSITSVSTATIPSTIITRGHAVVASNFNNVEQTSYLKRITQINLPYDQKIQFGYKNRYDKNSLEDSILQSVKVFDKNNLAYGYRLDYSYSDGSRLIPNYEFELDSLGGGDRGSNEVRVFLRRVIKQTAAGLDVPYEFEYNTAYFLPKRERYDDKPGLYSRDHWGFYNGKINSMAIPNAGLFTGGADRSPSSTHVLAGVLKKVTNPAGGTTEYEFESNDRIQLESSSMNTYFWSASPVNSNVFLSQYYASNHVITVSVDRSNVYSTGELTGCNYTLELKNGSGQIVASRDISLNYMYLVGQFFWELALPNGTYLLNIKKTGTCSANVDVRISLDWTNNIVTGAKVIGGGLRIKRITEDAGIGTPKITKEYRYVAADGNTSSGYMAFMPKYDYSYVAVDASNNKETYTVIGSEALNNLNYTFGNPVGYSRVEVIEGTASDNIGKTVYEFSDFRDIGLNPKLLQYPFAPIQKADWGLGLPKKISIYDAQGRLKKSTTNTFTIIQAQNTSQQTTSLKIGLESIKGGVSRFFYQWYQPLTGRTELTKSADTTFFENASLVTEETAYEYNQSNYNPSKIINVLDRQKGLKIERRLYYISDYNLTSGPLKILKDLGINGLVSSEEWITGDTNPRMIGGEITEFTQLANNVIVPFKKYAFNGEMPAPVAVAGNFNPATLNRTPNLFKLNFVFDRYDSKGNVLQTQNQGGQKNAVIPGADRSTAVATVENASYAEIAYSSFENSEKGNWEYSGATVADANAITGGAVYNLSNGSIKKSDLTATNNYIISFWAKTGTPDVAGAVRTKSETNIVRGWTYYEYTITGKALVTIGGSGVIDELRLYPATATMTTNTYNPFVGVTSECDQANRLTYYDYDKLNRLIAIRNSEKQIVQKSEYGYNEISHTNAIWDFTGEKRCQQNAMGNTGMVEAQQTDINFNSTTYMSTRWVVVGKSRWCGVFPIWANTGNKRCKHGTDGNNTGEVEIEQMNVNTNDPSYGLKIWISGGIDREFCPDLCIGENKKIVNGVCETGIKVYTWSKPLPDNGGYYCFYVYKFSDGSQTIEHREVGTSPIPCTNE